MDVFDVICSLIDLDMPLEKIQAYMKGRTPEKLMEVLKEEEEIIQEESVQLSGQRNGFGAKCFIWKRRCRMDADAIAVCLEPNRYLAYKICSIIFNEKAWARAIENCTDTVRSMNCRVHMRLGIGLK